jgi:outer membrane protein assembly factor BamD (BamD/ComL family)
MKKFLFVVLLAAGGIWYLRTHYHLIDVLPYAHAHQDKSWSQTAVYGVGMAYYTRSMYPPAQTAFTQLLTDYPTGQYTPRVLLRLDEMAEQNSDWSAAKQYLDQYLQDYPNGPDVQIAQQRRQLLYNK